jgi:hypothetical protein
MDNDKKMIAYLEHLDTNLYTNYMDQENATFQIYREETADGYEVFVAKYATDKNTYVNRDIHYYDMQFCDLVVEKLQEGESVYIDDGLFEDCYIEDRLADEYDEWQEELENEKEEDDYKGANEE